MPGEFGVYDQSARMKEKKVSEAIDKLEGFFTIVDSYYYQSVPGDQEEGVYTSKSGWRICRTLLP